MSAKLTPYGAAKVANEILSNLGYERQLPPQMFYNYVAKGYIPSDEEKKISREDLLAWFEGYFEKNIAKKSEKIEAELDDQAKFDLAENQN